MTLLLRPEELPEDAGRTFGGKAAALGRLARAGLAVPPALCLSVQAYRHYLAETELGDAIAMELERKEMARMRWEELWDAALRIRHLFLVTPIPARLAAELAPGLETIARRPLAVRSSALGEDAGGTSFAGLHDSFLGVSGTAAVLDKIRLVWASLWSDRALLYRRELGLDPQHSAMGVVVQELVVGEVSGVVFGRSPMAADEAVVEAVNGLNQGLVDGAVAPDRWRLARADGRFIDHVTPERRQRMTAGADGVELEALPQSLKHHPPLGEDEVAKVFALAQKAEALFGAAQDVEWTMRRETLFVLQARPITAAAGQDERSWYLSLHRSYENLRQLRQRIEGQLLPGMEDEARRLGAEDLQSLADSELAVAIEARRQSLTHWQEVYRREFIPFAHGMRLFGQVYNERLQPEDPYRFVALLRTSEMLSLRRNRSMQKLAAHLQREPRLRRAICDGCGELLPPALRGEFEAFIRDFGGQSWAGEASLGRGPALLGLLEQLGNASTQPSQNKAELHALEQEYLEAFTPIERDFAADLLDLGRASYRLRDDDNLFLGRIEGEVGRALDLARGRVAHRFGVPEEPWPLDAVNGALRDRSRPEPVKQDMVVEEKAPGLRSRQLVGQPAGPGLATGPARIVSSAAELMGFQAGEVLVCDAIDPNMTFVVPLAAAIVERRGGMLIHGAIIAREYGVPCVTGVDDAVRQIPPGVSVTVDGYLGVVTVNWEEPKEGR